MALLEAAFSNLVAALLLAVVALVVGKCCRRPAVTHLLWVLVLLKLVTPPLVRVPVPWLASAPSVAGTERTDGADEADGAEAADAPLLFEVVAAGARDPEPVAAPLPPPEAPPPAAAPSWPWWVGGLWLAGSAAWVVLAL
ncbi:MAG: hypothetical protein K2W96_16850, partial [Gemmataceae bacterium]|nr:hypothetical protein [Gemmataceae bacterium]